MLCSVLMMAQAADAAASAILYSTLLFIFLTAIVTTVCTKWARDKCLTFFHGNHVTLESARGLLSWGRFKSFSSGIEIVYDHPHVDAHGRKKTSYLIYQPETDQQMLTLFRYHDELDGTTRARRLQQIEKTFNPGFFRRLWRTIRNFVNLLRDAVNAAIGAIVGQYQRMRPNSTVLASQAGSVTALGQTLVGTFANAFEPLLEQYIGMPVILEVADPRNPNNAVVEYPGYLAEYTQNYIAVFNVDHTTVEWISVTLPDLEQGEPGPPLPPPPAPGAPLPPLPAPLKTEHNLALWLDGLRFKLLNLGAEPMVVRRLERADFEPFPLGVVIPPNGTLSLLARDARGGKLIIEIIRCLDVVAPRKFATVRHAGILVERPGLADMLSQLPLVPTMLRPSEKGSPRSQNSNGGSTLHCSNLPASRPDLRDGQKPGRPSALPGELVRRHDQRPSPAVFDRQFRGISPPVLPRLLSQPTPP